MLYFRLKKTIHKLHFDHKLNRFFDHKLDTPLYIIYKKKVCYWLKWAWLKFYKHDLNLMKISFQSHWVEAFARYQRLSILAYICWWVYRIREILTSYANKPDLHSYQSTQAHEPIRYATLSVWNWEYGNDHSSHLHCVRQIPTNITHRVMQNNMR